jgi:dUTP diphosphatase
MMRSIKLKRFPHADGIDMPTYEKEGDAGFDLRAAIPEDEPLVLNPGDRALIPTGFAFGINQHDLEIQIRPRSGLAFKHGITVMNSPGTIDSGFTGEVKVILSNNGLSQIEFTRGDRIAQAVLCPIHRAEFTLVDSLDETDRADSGFGSTGTK